MPPESQRESLPFEPKSTKKSSDRSSDNASAPASKRPQGRKASSNQAAKPKTSKAKKPPRSTATNKSEDTGIPEVVSRRMLRRIAVFAGVPTLLGMASFVVAYILLTQHIAEFPNVVVLLVSLSLFGLGTIGLTYGVLSASWEEDTVGSLLGISEFSVNFQRVVQGFRESKQASD